MNSRWLLGWLLLFALSSVTARAQAVVNNNYGGDPYATSGAGYYPGTGMGGLMPTSWKVDDRLWFRWEYLHMWTDGMDVPPLVTTSPIGTPQDQAAILGMPGTTTLFGGSEINGGAVSGTRFQAGFWLVQDGSVGIEGEYMMFADQNDGYAVSSDGTQIIGRPFFDITQGQETAQLVSYPNLVNGSLSIGSNSSFSSYLVNGRVSMVPMAVVACAGDVAPDRIDWIVGYRHISLDDSLSFREQLESQVTPRGEISLAENFSSSNEFNGLQLGVTYQANFRRAWLETKMRVALGNNTQEVGISGNTVLTENGVSDTYPGGLYAQRTNMGTHKREQFTMVPELGITFGFRLTSCLHATVGYNAIYLPAVVRAGEQIDQDVNPNLFPEETVPFVGALRPGFRFNETDYLAHGVNIGAELRF
ncbi:hypothetical protein FF011L_43310 [Roseimaritima multifibrata]|uniref:Uncharacterized protein n=1 Tax=Roseimaritima multifibrata TaxID=1930274 RepID=A0A517MKY0_9BACT|nr:BBP7 family outer membrane beta-barrel protein [Roseimaritima multifibrata]QDS95534.1 hypothetical protein FF011L_43310 [Roseimaritima multifibrata]